MAQIPTMSVRIEPNLRKEADEVFSRLGITPTTAITLFYKAVVREQGLPFEVTARPARPAPEPDSVLEQLLAAYLAERDERRRND